MNKKPEAPIKVIKLSSTAAPTVKNCEPSTINKYPPSQPFQNNVVNLHKAEFSKIVSEISSLIKK